MGTIFQTNKLLENEPLEKDENSELEFAQFYEEQELNKYQKFRFHRIRMSTFSDEYLAFTPKILEELNT